MSNLKQLQSTNTSKEYQKQFDNGGIYDWWFTDDNYSTWSHNICLKDYEKFFKAISPSKFLILGDGKGVKEGRFIKKLGHHVTSTDLVDIWLKSAKVHNHIDEYAVQDMENLTYDDNQFEYSLVKESLHHLQRPYKAIYEMYRVSSKGIIIIEPNDINFHVDINMYNFETDVGNFKYEFSLNELMKCSYGLDIKTVAYTFTNHPEEKYVKDYLASLPRSGSEFIMNSEKYYQDIKSRNLNLDEMSRKRLPLISFIIFKKEPSKAEIKGLRERGFTIEKLKDNPIHNKKCIVPTIDKVEHKSFIDVSNLI